MAEPFWFTVKYGDGQQELMNADCWSCVLCDFMKIKCGYADLDEPVDLLKDDGSCVGLQGQGKVLARETLASKGVYTLCKVVPAAEEGGTPELVALFSLPDGGE